MLREFGYATTKPVHQGGEGDCRKKGGGHVSMESLPVACVPFKHVRNYCAKTPSSPVYECFAITYSQINYQIIHILSRNCCF